MGLTPDNFRQLMRDGGFRPGETRPLREGAQGPPAPVRWSWRPPRKDRLPDKRGSEPAHEGAFAALSGLVR
jgi:ATP-dependent RNA helicase SUPV3L1/SUV3